LPTSGELIDVGCGAGVPVVRFLVNAGFEVPGVDISSVMLELARRYVPQAHFLKMDMRRLNFTSGYFDGISAFYSLFHIPRTEYYQVLVDFQRLLRPNGILLFCSGAAAWEGFDEYHGVKMFWSHPDRKETRQWVIDAGFSIHLSEVRNVGGEKQYWIMARRVDG